MISQLLCVAYIACALSTAFGQNYNFDVSYSQLPIATPINDKGSESLVGKGLRYKAHILEQFADGADQLKSTLRNAFVGSSKAVKQNVGNLGQSLGQTVETTNQLVNTGLDAGQAGVGTLYTGATFLPKTTSDAVTNFFALQNSGAPYAGYNPSFSATAGPTGPSGPVLNPYGGYYNVRTSGQPGGLSTLATGGPLGGYSNFVGSGQTGAFTGTGPSGYPNVGYSNVGVNGNFGGFPTANLNVPFGGAISYAKPPTPTFYEYIDEATGARQKIDEVVALQLLNSQPR